jgi:phosphoribosylanthranilate isomerase
MKLKVCGMKYLENIQQVAALQPDYLGFIFYEKSKRNFDGIIPELPKSIKKTGVFVNATIDEVVSKVEQYDLKAVQLHGDESVEYINELRRHFEKSEKSHQKNLKQALDWARVGNSVEIIKVFGIKNEFKFDVLKSYIDVVDYFLFDTKGKERGGNGIIFDWRVLKEYPFSKPFFLSGGLGLENTDNVLSFLRKQESKYCYALDVNSKFESEPGVKKIEKLKKFKESVITNVVK